VSEPFDHHFIPVFYLKRWAGADGKLVVYARKGGRIVVSRRNPRGTGFEPELYALDAVEPSRRQAVEKEFFGKMIDDRAAAALDILFSQGLAAVTDEHRVILSHFLMSLRARHPDAVRRVKEEGPVELRRHLELNPEEYERLREPGDPPTLAAAAERFMPARVANFGINTLQAVICQPKVGQRLFDGKWSVIDFENEPSSLLTGDRPCLLEGNLMSSGAFVVTLPISPTKLLGICDGEATERKLRELPSNDCSIASIARSS
jgi:hypothetical protein